MKGVIDMLGAALLLMLGAPLLALDIRILLLTVGAILGRRGIAHPGSVTTARSDGVR